jgi:hypothetical protein
MAEVTAEERTTVTSTTIAAPATKAVVATPPSRAPQVVYLIFSILEILLAFRLVLRLLVANSANAFVDLIYTISYPFITPFIGIFTLPSKSITSFEVATLVAMVVYAVVGYVIIAIIRLSTRTQTTA